MLRTAALFIAVGALAACHRDPSSAAGKDPNAEDQSGTSTITSAPFTTRESAVDRIVAARCAREVTCSNLGPGKHYESGDKCVSEVRGKLNAELGTNECPDGIDAKEVDQCLDAIRSESCANPLSTVQRLAACRTGTLCMKTAGRPLL